MQTLREPSIHHDADSELDLFAQGGTRCPQRVAERNAALPPNILRLSANPFAIVFRRANCTYPVHLPLKARNSRVASRVPDSLLFNSCNLYPYSLTASAEGYGVGPRSWRGRWPGWRRRRWVGVGPGVGVGVAGFAVAVGVAVGGGVAVGVGVDTLATAVYVKHNMHVREANVTSRRRSIQHRNRPPPDS